MLFYSYKKMIEQLQNEAGIKKDSLKVDKYINKHHYKVLFFVGLLMDPSLSLIPIMIAIVISILFFVIGYMFKILLFNIIALVVVWVVILFQIFSLKIMKDLQKGKDFNQVQINIINKIQGIYFINPLVINYADWWKLKKVSKANYETIRSVKSLKKCYETTFYIANILRKNNVKIIWLLNYASGEKFGHAVLAKGNWIYDSNRRKTYPKAKYLKVYRSEVYKEFTINEYLFNNLDEIIEEGIDSGIVYTVLLSDWINFKNFCTTRGGVRCTNDQL